MRKLTKYHERLKTAAFCLEQAETNLHDAWAALGFLGEKNLTENLAFKHYTEVEAFRADVQKLVRMHEPRRVKEICALASK